MKIKYLYRLFSASISDNFISGIWRDRFFLSTVSFSNGGGRIKIIESNWYFLIIGALNVFGWASNYDQDYLNTSQTYIHTSQVFFIYFYVQVVKIVRNNPTRNTFLVGFFYHLIVQIILWTKAYKISMAFISFYRSFDNLYSGPF